MGKLVIPVLKILFFANFYPSENKVYDQNHDNDKGEDFEADDKLSNSGHFS